MADHTKIQWTEATWSPVTGCTKTSEGCVKCYIDRTPPFRMAHRRFDKPGIGGTTGVMLHPERLDIPLHWRKPRRVFVCSLADLFHTDVPDDFVAEVFATMALAPQHTFQVLTKRHARLRALLNNDRFRLKVYNAAHAKAHTMRGFPDASVAWPLPNVHVGVSAENQHWADMRIPALLETPAAVRWVSAEPLLGPIRLHRWWTAGFDAGYGPAIDWLVAGGESGAGARPCDPDWIRALVEQCREGVTAPFVKQLGGVWAKDTFVGGRPVSAVDSKGGNWDLWPSDLRVREYPAAREAVTA
ncbi:phage Gp37/Gp68 family protein [Micromonospora tulbaghiae]|uniref:DUF5131 family protein n=1 Tax=Micromonospora tulbaghiae TaxID=479978 RepID=UPI0033D705CA